MEKLYGVFIHYSYDGSLERVCIIEKGTYEIPMKHVIGKLELVKETDNLKEIEDWYLETWVPKLNIHQMDPRIVDKYYDKIFGGTRPCNAHATSEDERRALKMCEYYESYGLDCDFESTVETFARIREYYESWGLDD